jgi:hypothetical protein
MSIAHHNTLKAFRDEVTGVTALNPTEVTIDFSNVGYIVKPYEWYQDQMAQCVVREILNANVERRAVEALHEITHNPDQAGLMGETILAHLLTSCGMSREEQTAALQAMGDIAEMMEHIDKYDRVLVFRALSSALPVALTRLNEIKTKKHANASTPSIRARGPAIVGHRREVKGRMTVAENMRRMKNRPIF